MPGSSRHPPCRECCTFAYAERWTPEQARGDGDAKATLSSAHALRPFHLAFPVHDLAAARAFYGGTLGCPEGRSAETWIDFDLFGHQIVAHLDPAAKPVAVANPVDGHDVPVPHFGVVLTMADWQALADPRCGGGHRVRDRAAYPLRGPAGRASDDVLPRPVGGNALEFKAFADDAMLFAT